MQLGRGCEFKGLWEVCAGVTAKTTFLEQSDGPVDELGGKAGKACYGGMPQIARWSGYGQMSPSMAVEKVCGSLSASGSDSERVHMGSYDIAPPCN